MRYANSSLAKSSLAAVNLMWAEILFMLVGAEHLRRILKCGLSIAWILHLGKWRKMTNFGSFNFM
jgi:hypothetical protein